MVNFEEACEIASHFLKKVTDAEFSEFYGYYKQATVGDCNTEKPPVTDSKKKGRWEAWNGRKGLSKEAAKTGYIKVFEKYQPIYGK